MSNTPDHVRDAAASDAGELTVLHSRSLSDLDQVQAHLMESDGRVADLFLRFVRETSVLTADSGELFSVLSRFTFETFPQATHFVLARRDLVTGNLQPLLVRDRDGGVPAVALSHTLVRKVMDEGLSVLYCRAQGSFESSESIRLSRINAAICAPLCVRGETIGILQLDIRHPGKGGFGRKEVDRLAVFANHVALVLDNFSLREQQRDAFESTIHALVHSLSLKDPETATHSERVQGLSIRIGRAMGLTGSALEALRVAAILHDMGKQGIHDEIIFKPARLLPNECDEMARHTGYTEDILNKIRYPAHLKDVPLIAAYHHEKMDGTGPYGIPGDRIPVQSRIISVADIVDALLSARAYKKPMPMRQVLVILEQGQDTAWDGAVIDALRGDLPGILESIYGMTVEQVDARHNVDDDRSAAA
jgi:HD-GYP domain-containing protein (c-di-GMP phosphodiesterase class II)